MSKNMKYVLFIASGILAFTVYIDGAQRMAVKDLAEVTVSGEGKNITQVLVDEKAKTDILKSNASAVYCLLEKCSS